MFTMELAALTQQNRLLLLVGMASSLPRFCGGFGWRTGSAASAPDTAAGFESAAWPSAGKLREGDFVSLSHVSDKRGDKNSTAASHAVGARSVPRR